MLSDRPTVLCLSGHDPGGGAGLQADIEAIAAQGAHVLGFITAHTVQDTRDVARVLVANPELLRQQVDAVLADSRPAAIKIGLLGDAATARYAANLIRRLGVPSVVDPVLRAGGGAELANDALVEALRRELLPLATLVTPNAAEARKLVPEADTLDGCGAALLAAGTENVLITGGDEPGDVVINHWHSRDHAVRRFAWPRVNGAFHGAGCTLAAAAAALLARKLPMAEALADAQAYVHHSLQHAHAPGQGRRVPGRIHR
ncbi:MAG TPA: hydroxymethylpyrimidine/phosphomethylpyrimidine kinase [Verrucomicrobiae bacterium]|nr:hydroxymethylpyrimidine/phosphomethylpyrimidine kinase [Verrucomicrobiae bacterium]